MANWLLLIVNSSSVYTLWSSSSAPLLRIDQSVQILMNGSVYGVCIDRGSRRFSNITSSSPVPRQPRRFFAYCLITTYLAARLSLSLFPRLLLAGWPAAFPLTQPCVSPLLSSLLSSAQYLDTKNNEAGTGRDHGVERFCSFFSTRRFRSERGVMVISFSRTRAEPV